MKPAPASYSSVPDLRIRWAPLRGRLLNLLVSPGDVFAEVIATRHAPARGTRQFFADRVGVRLVVEAEHEQQNQLFELADVHVFSLHCRHNTPSG